MYCKNCGKQIDDNSRFCNYCGASQGERKAAEAGQASGAARAEHVGGGERGSGAGNGRMNEQYAGNEEANGEPAGGDPPVAGSRGSVPGGDYGDGGAYAIAVRRTCTENGGLPLDGGFDVQPDISSVDFDQSLLLHPF